MAMVPKAQWAQNREVVYLTIDLQDVRDPKIDISNDASGKHGKTSFKGDGKSHATGEEKHHYTLDLDLYGVCFTVCHAVIQEYLLSLTEF